MPGSTTASGVCWAAALCIAVALQTSSAAGGGASGTVRAAPDAELQRAVARADLCSAGNAKGVGLRGIYFERALDQGLPLLVRTDGTVDFDASFDWLPQQPTGRRPASARWQGWVKPMVSGHYRFHADQPTASITVARQPLAGPSASADATIELTAGRFYPITLEVQHLDHINGRLRLEWTTPYGARFVVPQALLFMPTESVAATNFDSK
ncbi:PA14 domain-containing protein [Acidovorax sp. ACV01]|uniref:PA14 domain-containing protein n=1 Tax=Acidovorax sp. ACV01 TaxID=2769311 RepID=UPI00177C08C9|nr:PA14 domain-containing protein [Acidovorax sp. ACV01]MBD9391163.1 hypothetical protein [Acidovorax sp. ACV01]